MFYRVTKRVLLDTAVFAGELVVVMDGMPIGKGCSFIKPTPCMPLAASSRNSLIEKAASRLEAAFSCVTLEC
jgi:hypothetical protein